MDIPSFLMGRAVGGGGGGSSGVPAIQTEGNWRYRIYDDGAFEAWFYQQNVSATITTDTGVLYRSALTSLALPRAIYDGHTVSFGYANVGFAHNNYVVFGALASTYATGINYYALSGGAREANNHYTLTAYVFGTIS